jgi:hypothetical protein
LSATPRALWAQAGQTPHFESRNRAERIKARRLWWGVTHDFGRCKTDSSSDRLQESSRANHGAAPRPVPPPRASLPPARQPVSAGHVRDVRGRVSPAGAGGLQLCLCFDTMFGM